MISTQTCVLIHTVGRLTLPHLAIARGEADEVLMSAPLHLRVKRVITMMSYITCDICFNDGLDTVISYLYSALFVIHDHYVNITPSKI